MQQQYTTLEIPDTPQASHALPSAVTPRSWLEQWPAARRGLLANLFHEAVRSGQTTPARVVGAVQRSLRQRLRYVMPPFDATDETLHAVWRALQTAPQEAYAYAQTVLDWEALPDDERQRQKQARAVHYLRERMAQLPVTDPQLRYLAALGYAGTTPTNRAEASELIDGLLSARGKGRR